MEGLALPQDRNRVGEDWNQANHQTGVHGRRALQSHEEEALVQHDAKEAEERERQKIGPRRKRPATVEGEAESQEHHGTDPDAPARHGKGSEACHRVHGQPTEDWKEAKAELHRPEGQESALDLGLGVRKGSGEGAIGHGAEEGSGTVQLAAESGVKIAALLSPEAHGWQKKPE